MPTRLPLSRMYSGRHEEQNQGDEPPPTPPPKDPNYTPNHKGALRVAITQLPAASSLSCTVATRSASATRPPLSRYSSQHESDPEPLISSRSIERPPLPVHQRTPGSAPIPRVRPALEPGTPADVPSTLSSPRSVTQRYASDEQLGPATREHRSFTARRSKRRARSPPNHIYAPLHAEPSAAVAAQFGAAIAAASTTQGLLSTPASPDLDPWMSPDVRRGRSQDGRPPTREMAETTVENSRRSNSASPRSAYPSDPEPGQLSSKSLPTMAPAGADESPSDQVSENDQQPFVSALVEATAEAATATTLGATLDTPFESPAGWLALEDEDTEAVVDHSASEANEDGSDSAHHEEPSASTIPPSPLMAASNVHGLDANLAKPEHEGTSANTPVATDHSETVTSPSKIYESDGSSSRSSLRSSLFLCLEGGKSTRSSSLTVGDEVKDQNAESAECNHEEDDDDSGMDSTSVTANDSSSETANSVSYDDLTALPIVLKHRASSESIDDKPVHGWSAPAAVPILPATAALHRHHDQGSVASRDASFDSNVAPWCPHHHEGAFTSTTVTANVAPASKSRLGNFFRKSSRSVTSPPPVRQVTVQQHAQPYMAPSSHATPFDQAEPSYIVNISADGPPKSARKMNRLRAPFGSELKPWDEDAFRRWTADEENEMAATGRTRRQSRNHSIGGPPMRKLSISGDSPLIGGPPPAPSALANLNQGIAPAREGSSPQPAMSPALSVLVNPTVGSSVTGGSGGLSSFLRRKGSVADKRSQSDTPHGRSMSVSSASSTPATPRTASRLATSGNSMSRMAGVGESRRGGRNRGTTAEFAMAAAMIR